MTIVRFDLQELPVSSWQNSGGTTREIVSWPPVSGLDDFSWRASVATIDGPTPFSAFDGVDRAITLLEGNGILLSGTETSHWLDTPHTMFDFSGDAPLSCTLIGGSSTVFNFMTRRDQGRAELRILHEHVFELPAADHGLLLTLEGQYRVGTGYLLQGHGVWWGGERCIWRLQPASRGARLLAALWWPAEEPDPDAS